MIKDFEKLSYKMKTELVRNLIFNFYNTEDFSYLADAIIVAEDLIEFQKFPIKEYKNWRGVAKKTRKNIKNML